MNKRDKITAHIQIRNLTVAQSIALEDMLATWQQLGSLGASRWTSFFADGDGNFRPKILYNGHIAQKTQLLDEDDTWKGSDYRIDFDAIAWKIHEDERIRFVELDKAKFLKILGGTIRFMVQDLIKDLKYKIKSYKMRKYNKKCEKLPGSEVSCDAPSESPKKPCDGD